MEVKTQTASVDLGPRLDTVPTTVWDKDACTAKIRSVLGNAAEQVGLLLLEAKQNLPHGTFQAYCEEEFPEIPYRTLSLWMNKALGAKSATAAFIAPQLIQNEQKKLEELKATPGLTNPARKIEAQEAKIEKLITKMAPPVSFEKTEFAAPQTDKENRPPQPSPLHKWDPFSRDWYKPRPPCPGVEGTKHGEYRWSEQSQAWFQIHSPGQQQPVMPRADTKAEAQAKLAYAFTTVLYTNTPEARKLMKQLFSSAFHPDSGKIRKDGQLMSDINQALSTLEG